MQKLHPGHRSSQQLSDFYTQFLVPFHTVFSSLNGGILTLYEIFNRDRAAEAEDLNLFLLFLEVYGTGRVCVSEGGLQDMEERRMNTHRRVVEVIDVMSKMLASDEYESGLDEMRHASKRLSRKLESSC